MAVSKLPYPAKVIWEDAYVPYSGSARTLEEIDEYHEPLLVETVGWLVLDAPDVVCVAGQYISKNALEFRDFIYIPRGMVRKVQKLK